MHLAPNGLKQHRYTHYFFPSLLAFNICITVLVIAPLRTAYYHRAHLLAGTHNVLLAHRSKLGFFVSRTRFLLVCNHDE
jgi:hypothetical protein